MVWGAAMLMLFVIRDLGSSLMFFGGFLALLYVATNRLSFVVVGLALFALGAWFLGPRRAHVTTASTPGCTRSTRSTTSPGGSYQIAQSLFAQADGGLFGTRLRAGAARAARRRAAAARPRRPTSSTR